MKKDSFRIVWAVDPFAKPARFQRSAARALQEMTRDVDAEIFPVHVLSAGISERVRELAADTFTKIRRRGQSLLDGIVGKMPLPVRPLHVLPKQHSTLKGAAMDVIRLSQKIQADLIVLSTHARTGPQRWLLGSFAETFSNISTVPILVAPPTWNPTSKRKTVLFPTDFSRESMLAFDRFLEVAVLQKWSVTIFHHVDFPIYPAYEFAFAYLDTYEDDLRAIVKYNRGEAEKLLVKARRVGVKANVVIDSGKALNATTAVLKQLKKGYLFLAMASQSGLLRNSILGGTTRQLIRKSPVPVWVIHPEVKAKRRNVNLKAALAEVTPDERGATFVL